MFVPLPVSPSSGSNPRTGTSITQDHVLLADLSVPMPPVPETPVLLNAHLGFGSLKASSTPQPRVRHPLPDA